VPFDIVGTSTTIRGEPLTIGDDGSEGESEDTGETTLSSDIKEDDLDHQQQALVLGQARRDKSSRTTRVPLPKKRSRADTVIASPLLPNP
jgi:hypothetical protein